MQGTDNGADVPLDGEGLRIAIVRARFNDAVTRKLEEACLAELAVLGVAGSPARRFTPAPAAGTASSGRRARCGRARRA